MPDTWNGAGVSSCNHDAIGLDLGYCRTDRKGTAMLSEMCNEDVVVHSRRTGGQVSVKAMVQPKTIFVADERVKIESDDVIERTLPSGVLERYVVVEPGFWAATHGVEGHYQIKFRREGASAPLLQAHQIYMSGPNSRVNLGSTDRSTNTVNLNAANEGLGLPAELRLLREEMLRQAEGDPDHYIAVGVVASAEKAALVGDEARVGALLGKLGEAGKWVLDIAKDVSAKIVAELISKSAGA